VEQRTAQNDVLIVVFECAYCGQGFQSDLLAIKIECPGCGARPSYEQILTAVPPMSYKRMIIERPLGQPRTFSTEHPKYYSTSCTFAIPPTDRYGDVDYPQEGIL
jgi:hypothetical protein